jgi:hypothetical protein
MLRRFGKRFVYVLIAALLLAQQGTALHALAHGVDALKVAKQAPTDQRGLPGDRHCDLCLTYAQMASGAAATTQPASAPALELPAAHTVLLLFGAVLGRAYHSRAPPRAH